MNTLTLEQPPELYVPMKLPTIPKEDLIYIVLVGAEVWFFTGGWFQLVKLFFKYQ
jgi:hypothetical protein